MQFLTGSLVPAHGCSSPAQSRERCRGWETWFCSGVSRNRVCNAWLQQGLLSSACTMQVTWLLLWGRKGREKIKQKTLHVGRTSHSQGGLSCLLSGDVFGRLDHLFTPSRATWSRTRIPSQPRSPSAGGACCGLSESTREVETLVWQEDLVVQQWDIFCQELECSFAENSFHLKSGSIVFLCVGSYYLNL